MKVLCRVLKEANMGGKLRRTSIEVVGDVPWGTHFCQFYETKEDLTEILVPYFKAGLENNEFCMWITSEPLTVKEAENALKEKASDLDDCIKKGQIEILSYSQWYTKSGYFDSGQLLQGWVEKEKKALRNGFDGLRLTGNTFWLEKRDWRDFTEYEAAVNSIIGKYRMLAICTYSLEKCGASEIIDVVSNHQFALIKRSGRWEIIESAEHRKTALALQQSEEKFRLAFENVADAIFWADPENGLITNCNRAAEILLEKKKADIIGQHHTTLHPPQKAGYYQALFRKHVKQAEVFNGDGEVITSSGIVRPVSITASLMSVGEKSIMQAIFCDLTERKRWEEELQRAKRELTIRNKIADIFLTVPDEEMFGEVLQVVLEAMESEYGIFGYIDEHGVLVIPSMTRDVWEKCQVPGKTIVFPREKWAGIWGRALVEKRSLFANEGLHVPEGHVPIAKVLVVPVVYGEQVIGLLEVANKSTGYSCKDQEFLETIAGKIAPILNARLQRDRQEKERRQAEEALKLHETRLESLLDLNKMSGASQREIVDFVREEVIRVTQSKLAFIGFMDEDASVMTIDNWSNDAMAQCAVVDKPMHFPVAEAGLWAEPVRQRKAIIINDYGAAGRYKKGTPRGHVPIKRFLGVPVLDGERIVAVAAVANKEGDYDESDARAFTSMLNDMWRLICRKQAEEDLKKYRQNLEELVQARTEELTEANKQLLHEIERRRNLEKEILAISEKEQRRIGQELHDSLGQQLAGIAMMSKLLQEKLKCQSRHESDQAKEITSLINQTIDQTRNLARGLDPVDLDARGLMSALQELATRTERLFGVSCVFKCGKVVLVEDPSVALHIYRIAQEAITNAIKHGKTKSILLELAYGQQTCVLTMKSDGRSFSEAPHRGKGMGLQIMRERADIIKGSLYVRRGAGGGTVMTCVFPNERTVTE